jgi:hypothetical protein
VASYTLQLVASTFASSAPGLSPHLAASSVVVFFDIPIENGFSFAGSCCGFGGLSCGFASCAFVRVYTDV